MCVTENEKIINYFNLLHCYILDLSYALIIILGCSSTFKDNNNNKKNKQLTCGIFDLTGKRIISCSIKPHFNVTKCFQWNWFIGELCQISGSDNNSTTKNLLKSLSLRNNCREPSFHLLFWDGLEISLVNQRIKAHPSQCYCDCLFCQGKALHFYTLKQADLFITRKVKRRSAGFTAVTFL